MAIEFKQHWKMWSVMAASAAATFGMALLSRRARLMGRVLEEIEKPIADLRSVEGYRDRDIEEFGVRPKLELRKSAEDRIDAAHAQIKKIYDSATPEEQAEIRRAYPNLPHLDVYLPPKYFADMVSPRDHDDEQ